MEKIKRIINCPIPVTACNFKCHYCYVGQEKGFRGEISKLKHDLKFIVYALRKERMGGVCLINLCACGETLMAPYIVELTRLLLQEGHCITLVTNGSLSQKFDEICELPQNILERLFIKFSFHYLELKRLNLFDKYFENVNKIKNKGIAFTIELTANDESIPYIDDIKKVCQKNLGTLCHIIESRNHVDTNLCRLTKLPAKEHLKHWESFDTPLISFQKTTWGKHRNEFCYAGDWLLNFDIIDGNANICLKGGKKVTNLYDNPDEPLHLTAIGQNCPWAHCYSSYFLMTNGIIPEYDSPCYGHLRNRVCTDGSEWLSPWVKDFFNSKLVESNKEYSDNKKLFINTLMSLVYKNKKFPLKNKQLAKVLEDELVKRGIKHISIFGHDKKSSFLLNLLKNTSIKVDAVVTEKYKRENITNFARLLKSKIYKIYYKINGIVFTGDICKNDSDLIVVTDYEKFDEIKKHLCALDKTICTKIIPISELVEE